MSQAINRKIAYGLLAFLTLLLLLGTPHSMPSVHAEDCSGANSGSCG